MARPDFEHLDWSKAHGGRHRFDLADSAVAAPDLVALGLPHHGGLPADGYAVALPALERALGARVGAPGGRVLVTAGASEANAIALAALTDPGDEVLVESPGYQPLHRTPAFLGARVRPFARDVARPGALAAAVEAALGPATRAVVVTDLHNPSGAPLADADVAGLEALAGRRGLWLLVDETFRDASARPCGTLAARGGRWVTTSTLTKAYGLGGLRIGWVAGPAAALARCAEAQNALSVQPALPSVTLALALVPHLDALRARGHALLAANHARMAAFTAAHDWCALAHPPSGTTAWCVLPEGGSGDALSALAAERHDLAVAPGRFFGEPRGLRISLGGECGRFAAALDILARAASEHLATLAHRGGAS